MDQRKLRIRALSIQSLATTPTPAGQLEEAQQLSRMGSQETLTSQRHSTGLINEVLTLVCRYLYRSTRQYSVDIWFQEKIETYYLVRTTTTTELALPVATQINTLHQLM